MFRMEKFTRSKSRRPTVLRVVKLYSAFCWRLVRETEGFQVRHQSSASDPAVKNSPPKFPMHRGKALHRVANDFSLGWPTRNRGTWRCPSLTVPNIYHGCSRAVKSDDGSLTVA